MSSPRTPNPSGFVGRQRRSAVRYTNLEKATSSPILTKPNRTVNFDPTVVEHDKVGAIAGMQGWRKTMEDRHALSVFPAAVATTGGGINNQNSDGDTPSRCAPRGALIAVFDGHRGTDAAAFASDLIPQALLDTMAGQPFDLGDGVVDAPFNDNGASLDGTATALSRITDAETLQRVFAGVDAKLRRIWEEQSLLSSRAASLETPVLGENSSIAATSTSGDFAPQSNPTSGQSSPQELSCSTLRAPPTPGSGDSSTITGTTATVAIALDEAYVFINVGDSRSYLVTRRDVTDEKETPMHQGPPVDVQENIASSDGSAEQCDSGREHLKVVLPKGLVTKSTSKDHRTSDPAECARVEAAGGYVVSGRVNGKLSVTRALGDFDLKPNLLDASCNPVVCTPDVVQLPRTAAAVPSHALSSSMKRRGTAQFGDAALCAGRDGDAAASVFEYDLLVVGCDGVWELQSIETMALLVDQKVQDIATALHGTTPTDREQFGPLLEAVLKEAVSEILVKCCAQSCDPNGSTLGADNMSLGLMLLPLHA